MALQQLSIGAPSRLNITSFKNFSFFAYILLCVLISQCWNRVGLQKHREKRRPDPTESPLQASLCPLYASIDQMVFTPRKPAGGDTVYR